MTAKQSLTTNEIALLQKLNLDPKDPSLKAKIQNILQSIEESQSFNNNQIDSPLQSIKILDPAGGSGAFPNQIHNYLVKKTVEVQTQQAIDDGFENFVPDERTIDKGILNNNIFMVDLQPESVEIAKLSLWLKTARKDQKLDNLDENIKCGNSLIDDPEIAGDKAFDWEEEFGWLRNDKNQKADDKT